MATRDSLIAHAHELHIEANELYIEANELLRKTLSSPHKTLYVKNARLLRQKAVYLLVESLRLKKQAASL